MGTQTDRVRFNVRGKIFETSATTLASVSRDSMFGAMLDYEWNQQPAEGNKEYFIDRDPDCFNVLLNLLATGEFHVPPNVPERLLYREAHYYGLLDHVKTANISEFDCNWLKLKRSVRSVRREAPGNYTAIRASPDGGCAVSHGGLVRVYDWMLEEHRPLNLDYQEVSDIGWIDSENIVISSNQKAGGIGLFSSSTGDIRHRFQLNDGKDQVKGFAAKALCFNSDNKIFASCKGTSYNGIGVWDQVTGKQIDSFKALGGTLFGDADKIQWLSESNCLFVTSMVSSREQCAYDMGSINLLDFRDKSRVWSMTSSFSITDPKRPWRKYYVVDATPVEESNSICVVNSYEDLGFIDFRSADKSVRWNSEHEDNVKRSHPKLTSHGGQLFCSMDDKITVYRSGLDQWVLTSTLGRCEGGSTRDFSIGGDRLFALHSEENVFDVWETPSAPIIS